MSDIKQVAGIWLPVGETHLVGFLEHSLQTNPRLTRGAYQIGTLMAFVDAVPIEKRNTVLDIGGHVGLWSMHLRRYFTSVQAFEPVPVLQECFEKNVFEYPHNDSGVVTLSKFALGAESGTTTISIEPDNSGHTHILGTDSKVPGVNYVDIEVKTLDSLNLEFGAMKIDVEGFEFAVLLGGEKSIRTNKPVICVEQKPHGGRYSWEQFDAIKLLMSWGAKPVRRAVDDYILVWES